MTAPEAEFGRARRYPVEPIQKGFAELTTRELHDILALRNQVFVVEQDCVYNDIDGRDVESSTIHLWFEHEGTIAAYVRQLDDGNGVLRIGRVVTNPDHRGQGLSGQLIDHVIAQHRGSIVLDAQSYLFDWYTRLGFSRSGEDFIEDGIAHVPMRMDLESHPVE